jgi:AcrR family transcriptional regulator
MATLLVASVSESVKRHYVSTLRAEQARATRRAIVDAAAQLFVERGYGATTVDAIAEKAGVSRKTVFTSVGGKVEALKLAVAFAIAGDDEPVALLDRSAIERLRQEPDARRLLRGFAAVQRGVATRVASLAHVAESATGIDPALRELAEASRRHRLTSMRALARELAARGALPDGLSVVKAADVLWVFSDPLTYHRLVLERGWSPKRYEEWIGDALVALLVRADYAIQT